MFNLIPIQFVRKKLFFFFISQADLSDTNWVIHFIPEVQDTHDIHHDKTTSKMKVENSLSDMVCTKEPIENKKIKRQYTLAYYT